MKHDIFCHWFCIFGDCQSFNKCQFDHSTDYSSPSMIFEQNNFDKAQEELIYVEFTDVLLNISARGLLIKIYFEQQEWEALDYSMENFRIFLLRTKKMEEKRRSRASVHAFVAIFLKCLHYFTTDI